jgi:hypothetical protein
MALTTTASTGMSSPTVFNLKGIRNAVFRQLDWAPSQSNTAKNRVDEFIQRAYLQMSQDAPYLFFEETTRLPVLPDIEPGGTTDLVRIAPTAAAESNAADAWTFRTELDTSVTTGRTAWATDRSWDGRLVMLKQAGTTNWHHRRIRSVWDATSEGITYTFFTIDVPWLNRTDTGVDWRVVNNEYVFPNRMLELRNISLLENSTQYPYPLEFVSQQQAEYSLMPNNTTLTPAGAPRYVYRRSHQQIPGPTLAPTITAASTWQGPQPEGEFEYCYTYVWGIHEPAYAHANPDTSDATGGSSQRHRPYWESAPSPVSDLVNVPAGGSRVQLGFPHVNAQLGFEDGGTWRAGQSGLNIRIYRRRVSNAALVSGYAGSFTTDVESPNTFYLLGEVTTTFGATVNPTFTDDGGEVPDMGVPLVPVHGYMSFRLHPRPSERMVLSLRAIMRPVPLTDDSDVPTVHADGIDCIITRTLAYMYEAQGNTSSADRSLNQYERALMQLNKRYGTLKPSSRPIRRSVARVRKRWRPRNQPLVDDAT